MNITNTTTKLLIFLFFSLILTIKSGYTIFSALISLIALFSIKYWYSDAKKSLDSSTKKIIFLFLILGLIWQHEFDSILSWNSRDILLKYILGILTLLFLTTQRDILKYIQLGLITGGMPLLTQAFFQVNSIGRAEGYTNAIQYGGIAAILSTFCLCFVNNKENPKALRILLFISYICYTLAAILSLSRGVYPLLAIAPFTVLLITKKLNFKKTLILLSILTICISSLLSSDIIKTRLSTGYSELTNYINKKPNSEVTSIGQRLEQWETAIYLGKSSPVFGWGNPGYENQKKKLVEEGAVHKSVLLYNHSHNEILDMFARRGLFGILVLFLCYAIPAYVFLKKILSYKQKSSSITCLSAAGLHISIGYFIFGLTQVFFAHNNGHIIYIFTIAIIYGAIVGIEKTLMFEK